MFLPLTNYEFDFGMKSMYDFNMEIILFHHFRIVSGKKRIDFEFDVEDCKILFDFCSCL